MLRYDITNLCAWMCIVQNLEFVVIVSDRGLRYSLNVYITMQIIILYLVKWHRDGAWYIDNSLTTWVSVLY